jgi:hypothetical protein
MLYSQASKQNIDNAVKKARKAKPKVKILGYGKFLVTGSGKEAASCYSVEFSKVAGELAWACSCKGHAHNQVCYHSVSCSALFKQQIAERGAFLTTCSLPFEHVTLLAAASDGDFPEQSESLAGSASQVACERCEAQFEPEQWEIDAVVAGDGYYLCGPCTHYKLEKHNAQAVYLVTVYEAGVPAYA